MKLLNGDALLETMHAHGNKESLVYWLEFKNEAEFPGPTFGGIAGGSAHKFGLFRRKDTGQWVTGSPQNEVNITQAEAVVVARSASTGRDSETMLSVVWQFWRAGYERSYHGEPGIVELGEI